MCAEICLAVPTVLPATAVDNDGATEQEERKSSNCNLSFEENSGLHIPENGMPGAESERGRETEKDIINLSCNN